MIEFFRDTLSGVYYYIYVALNILFILAIIGYVGEKKEKDSKSLDDGITNSQVN